MNGGAREVGGGVRPFRFSVFLCWPSRSGIDPLHRYQISQVAHLRVAGDHRRVLLHSQSGGERLENSYASKTAQVGHALACPFDRSLHRPVESLLPLIIPLESMSCGDSLPSGRAIIEVGKPLNCQSQPGDPFPLPALAHHRPRLRNETNYKPPGSPQPLRTPAVPNEPSPISGHLEVAASPRSEEHTSELQSPM